MYSNPQTTWKFWGIYATLKKVDSSRLRQVSWNKKSWWHLTDHLGSDNGIDYLSNVGSDHHQQYGKQDGLWPMRVNVVLVRGNHMGLLWDRFLLTPELKWYDWYAFSTVFFCADTTKNPRFQTPGFGKSSMTHQVLRMSSRVARSSRGFPWIQGKVGSKSSPGKNNCRYCSMYPPWN